ncbi:MAG: DUF3794 domain-containing protein [Oscillospiraceae bacterium]|nr:DUF3794 domain-containing protein [Oscillospiraceae bacterium]
MDFKVNKETISVSECIYEGMQEQSIELDYILPDYYSDIFRLVRCEAVPTVTGYSINGDKLNYELRCDIRILYCSEAGGIIQCVNQKQTFSRSLDLGRVCENPTAELKPKTDYINYRALNKRRLDVRGAVSVKIKVSGENSQEVISDAFGMNVKVRRTPVKLAQKKLSSSKSVQLSEEIEINDSQPAIINIIKCECRSIKCDKKLISGKIMAKGEALIKLLYSCEKDGGAVEPLEFTVPFSQIMDMDGVDDSYEINMKAGAVYCEAVTSAVKSGENRSIRCEAEIRLECTGIKSATVMLGTDAYSTTHPCNTVITEIRAEQIPAVIESSIHSSAKLCEGDNMPVNIYDLWCTPKNINTRLAPDEKKVIISGMLTYTTAGKDSSGFIVMSDKDETFEESFDIESCSPDGTASCEVTINSVSYNITPENTLNAKADLNIRISVYSSSSIKAVSEINVDGTVKKVRDGDYALKLYYGIENENIWDIAKKYSTSVDAIMEENNLYGEKLEKDGMLLIPMVL